MADSNIPITPGTGANVDTYQLAGGDHQQFVREAPASAVTSSTWTLSGTASTSVLTADATRRALVLWNTSSSVTVYLRYDTTAPTTTAWHDQLAPGARLEVAKELVTQPVSLIASGTDASNPLKYCTGTAALWASRFPGSWAGC